MSRRIKDFVLDLFFPNRCPLCGNVIKWDIPYCEKCYDELPQTGSELCLGCGNGRTQCVCGSEKLNYVRCYAAFYYTGVAKEAVVYLKNTKNRIFPDIVAEKLYDDICGDHYKFKADYIIPVPMSKIKLRKRGYNQAEMLARSLSDILKIPVKTDALAKRESLIAQHKLSLQMRKKNAENIYFKGNPEGLEGKVVILCDDVMTTGSTINECAGLLKEMGAAAVIAAAAATTIR